MKSFEKKYVKQPNGYEFGNFIMNTPTIKALSNYYGKPINVYFETDTVGKMFDMCPFIKSISLSETKDKEMIYEANISNSAVNLNEKSPPFSESDMSDYDFIYETVLGKLGLDTSAGAPYPYVDEYDKPSEIPYDDYVLIIRGGNHKLPDYWVAWKDCGHDIYRKIIKEISLPIVFIGNNQDYHKYIQHMKDYTENPIIILNDIKKSLGAIKHAKYIVANDTGMYHAAGALNKDMFVMWKDMPFVKNMVPSKKAKFSHKGNWYNEWLEWKKNRDI